MKAKILDIIQNDNFPSHTQKLIEICKVLGISADESASALGIPKMLLQNNDEETPSIDKGIKNHKPKITEYIKLFYDHYKIAYNEKYIMNKKEIGNLGYIMKKINLDEWEKMVKLIFHNCKKMENGKKLSFTWNLICEDVRPSIVYSRLAYIRKEIKAIENLKKSVGDFRNDSKKSK